MPCLGCTEPEFPHHDLLPGTVFKTPTVLGVPRDLPTGTDKKRYVAYSAAAKAAAPEWVEKDIKLDNLQRPQTFYSTFTQTGCTRSLHFSYKVSATEFGQRKGCLFYDLGCRGPMTHSSCNRILWNRQSSKTRAGMPCIGCTEPEFPFFDLAPGTVFKTQTVMGLPRELPGGVDKAGYIKVTAAAKLAAPSWTEEDIFVV